MTTYKDAGVNLERGGKFAKSVQRLAATTITANVLPNDGGGFASCYELPTGYKQPVIVTSTDGVGTKLKLALDNDEHLFNIGADLVAMVVNDIICCGAKPLIFLDYFATSELDLNQGERVLAGASDACLHCGVSLTGGETAELPGMYFPGDFDVAGFGVGIVEKSEMIDGETNVKEGDVIIGIASSGPHSNGFSLIRKVLSKANAGRLPSIEMIESLMKPTNLYPPTIAHLQTKIKPHGIAHITGGGFFENIPRIVHHQYTSEIEIRSWEKPEVFGWLQSEGDISEKEMYSVFNMGIGMVVVVDPEDVDDALWAITEIGLNSWAIGRIVERDGKQPVELV